MLSYFCVLIMLIKVLLHGLVYDKLCTKSLVSTMQKDMVNHILDNLNSLMI
ncbi:hypothetical protein XBP1_270141 [Xenorhabdus bovienii str. puntauvense]|uniref:Uncharacterized protein n=2 Tax=Xenorhabdus bovienii TaxID=40576 RepID=A0A077N5X4_XENBV|nr:hypothetical protein XBFFR1_720001 [Xenorhabdus bovienii str. feltiae France]CDG93100.1 hypothetical protein XBFFL1_2400001 [Xenorhabdus bovienii str. feltiae Florida]CDG97601.1 hypothetical protein XBP1_270141 [Xenorhabdus bovienii str. puntauvense]CDH03188.1 hypothetical protein XBFM1_60017 [Xenorhabdus bovienii str. feltiae Moldova]